jgi:predicted ArsR family transcriptional regulator
MSVHETDTSIHRALADERRARILAELESWPAALDATEIGRRVGLHPNTVRWHLGILVDAGLVSPRPEPRTTPGRPRITYRLERTAQLPRRDEYRLLATVLAGIVAGEGRAAAACEQAGERWGRELVQAAPGTRSDEAALEEVVELLAEQGFEPTTVGAAIEMRRCPFLDLAETNSEVVCAVHRGLISGALAERGSKLAVSELEIFPRPGVCVARLAPGA